MFDRNFEGVENVHSGIDSQRLSLVTTKDGGPTALRCP